MGQNDAAQQYHAAAPASAQQEVQPTLDLPPEKTTVLNSAPQIRAAADQCVKCGLCLPHCPTYRQSSNEGESPRGRIALIQALADAQLEATPGTVEHLDSCLGCLNCESACPAKVDYSGLLDAGRQMIAAQTGSARLSLLVRSMATRRWQRYWQGLLRFYQSSGLRWVAQRVGFLGIHQLARLDAMLPPAAHTSNALHTKAPKDASAPVVHLFSGCTGTLFDQQTLADSRRLITALGYRIELLDSSLCCGALHAHGGDTHTATALQQRWHQAVANAHTVLGIATGCSAHLRRQSPAERSDLKIQDLIQWLAGALNQAHFRPLHQRWALHLPCSLRNDLKASALLEQALARIPALELIPFGPPSGCCGAAGRHLLDRPAQADALLQPYLGDLANQEIEGVLSPNIGCSLHLRQGLTLSGHKLPVRHPVGLLADQLVTDG